MLSEKLANDIAEAALTKLQTKTAGWKRPAALAAGGAALLGLAGPTIAEMSRDAGTMNGLADSQGNILTDNSVYNDNLQGLWDSVRKHLLNPTYTGPNSSYIDRAINQAQLAQDNMRDFTYPMQVKYPFRNIEQLRAGSY